MTSEPLLSPRVSARVAQDERAKLTARDIRALRQDSTKPNPGMNVLHGRTSGAPNTSRIPTPSWKERHPSQSLQQTHKLRPSRLLACMADPVRVLRTKAPRTANKQPGSAEMKEMEGDPIELDSGIVGVVLARSGGTRMTGAIESLI
ncbi:hypothetical protein PM082_020863 [Marasmius tenuissimus]|nr:hypothetical protein PM082_020863 [Marasmius tenuissimus]